MLSTHTKALDIKVPAPLTELPPRMLETQRLTLRALQHGDNEVMFKAYAGNSVATKYMSFSCASSSQESLPFLQGVVANFAGQESAHKEFSWLIFRKDVGECIGSVGLGVNSPTALGGGTSFIHRRGVRGSLLRRGRRLLHGLEASPTSSVS